MSFLSFLRTLGMAGLFLLGGCLAPATSVVSGGGNPTLDAPAPKPDEASEKPTDLLGSNTESSDLEECEKDPTLAKCSFPDAPPATYTGFCLPGQKAVRFVFFYLAPGTAVESSCFFQNQQDGAGYLNELAKIDSEDTVAGWRYLDTCVALNDDGTARQGFTFANGAPPAVGYRGFYFAKTEDITTFANESTFDGVEKFRASIEDVIAKKIPVHPALKLPKDGTLQPPKDPCVNFLLWKGLLLP
jgi:hypothetical protein